MIVLILFAPAVLDKNLFKLFDNELTLIILYGSTK